MALAGAGREHSQERRSQFPQSSGRSGCRAAVRKRQLVSQVCGWVGAPAGANFRATPRGRSAASACQIALVADVGQPEAPDEPAPSN